MSQPRADAAAAIGLMVAANVLFAFNDVWLRRIADDIGLRRTTLGAAIILGLAMLAVRGLRPGLTRSLDEPPALPSDP